MIGEILYAIQQEILAFLKQDEQGIGTVIHHTMFSVDNWPTYTMPLFTLRETPGEDFGEMIGGRTLCEWIIELSAYNVAPDVGGVDPSDYSATRINVIDDLRRHFKTYNAWLTPEMANVKQVYGLKWTLTGSGEADPLDHPNGIVDGKKLVYATLSWDVDTDGTEEIEPLQTIVQKNPPPAH